MTARALVPRPVSRSSLAACAAARRQVCSMQQGRPLSRPCCMFHPLSPSPHPPSALEVPKGRKDFAGGVSRRTAESKASSPEGAGYFVLNARSWPVAGMRMVYDAASGATWSSMWLALLHAASVSKFAMSSSGVLSALGARFLWSW